MPLAFGEWEQTTGMTDALSEQDRARFARVGMIALAEEQGLRLIDIAPQHQPLPATTGTPKQTTSYAPKRKTGTLPQIIRGLTRTPTRHTSNTTGSLTKTTRQLTRNRIGTQ